LSAMRRGVSRSACPLVSRSGRSCGGASVPADASPGTGRLREPDPAERAVSLLAAEGLTNGAVARRLYMSRIP
jgi:DNA-binding NarL/FixJ family response regulator